MSPKPVAILLATKNGASFLPDQMRSLHRQRHTNWCLLHSDDGSQDGTTQMVASLSRDRLAHQTVGPGAGFAQNFLHLLGHVPSGHYAAFCDQDDVWLPDKLSHALKLLGASPVPSLVCGATLPCSADLAPLDQTRPGIPKLGFGNALVQNQATGHTIVMNPAAVEVLQSVRRAAWAIPAHDWWCYLCIAAVGGRLIYDPHPRALYRQHGQNAIGVNTGLAAKTQRVRQMLRGDYKAWIDANLAALRPLRPMMPASHRETLDQFHSARNAPLRRRLTNALHTDLYRHGRLNQWAWLMALTLGKT